MKQAIMIGAGNIGRGFIGALLEKSGYHVTFADVAENLISAINERKATPSTSRTRCRTSGR